jgi:hypothetical protein
MHATFTMAMKFAKSGYAMRNSEKKADASRD